MGIKPITISFKNTDEDAVLNAWILSHSNYSGFIKDKLREAKKSEENPVVSKTANKAEKGLIDLDF